MPQPYTPWHPAYNMQPAYFQNPLQPFPVANQIQLRHGDILNKNPKSISTSELTILLNDNTEEIKRLDHKQQQQQAPALIEITSFLIHLPNKTLATIIKNDFFSLLRNPLIDLLQLWSDLTVPSLGHSGTAIPSSCETNQAIHFHR